MMRTSREVKARVSQRAVSMKRVGLKFVLLLYGLVV